MAHEFLNLLRDKVEEEAIKQKVIFTPLKNADKGAIAELETAINIMMHDFTRKDPDFDLVKLKEGRKYWISWDALNNFAKNKNIRLPHKRTLDILCCFIGHKGGWQSFIKENRAKMEVLEREVIKSPSFPHSETFVMLLFKWDEFLTTQAKGTPNLWEVVYEGKELPKEAYNQDFEQKISDLVFQMILFWESVIMAKEKFNLRIYNGWREYRIGLYRKSKAIQATVEKNKHYISTTLLKEFGLN